MSTPHLSRGVVSRRARVARRRRLFLEGLEDRRLMALLAEDSFDYYDAGEQVETATTQLNAGTGWTTPYDVLNTRQAAVTIANAALSYSGGAITVDGGSKALRFLTPESTGNEIFAGRGFAAETNTAYFSFLYRVVTNPDRTSDFLQTGFSNSVLGEPLLSGLDNSGTFRVRRGTSGTGITVDSAVPANLATTYFVVGKAEKTGAVAGMYDKVSLFVNPTTLTEPGVPTVTTTGTAGSTMGNVNFFTFRRAFLETGDDFLFDELRIGNTYTDVLPRAAAPQTLSASLVGGALTITDTDGTGKNNNLTVSRTSSNLIITDNDEGFISAPAGGTLSNGFRTLIIPIASVTAGLTINGANGNDLITVNLAAGNPFPTGGISVNGGNPTTGPGDRVAIVGGAQGDVTYNYTNANSGSVVMSAFGTLNYTGLEPLTNSGTATNVVFNLPGANDAGITLSNLGGGQARLAGTTFEQTDFTYPAAGGSITVNLGANNQALSVNSLALNANTDLIIDGQGGADAVNVAGGAGTVTITDQLSVTAETINQTQGAIVTGATLLDAGAAGTITLTNAANNFNTVTVTNAGTASLLDTNTGFILGGATTTTSLTVSSDDTITQTGAIGGAGGLIKQGTGALNLSLANAYAGLTTVSVGEVLVSHADGLGTSAGATTVVGTGAWVRVANGVTVANETLNLAGVGEAATSTGGLISDVAGTSTWNGPINLDANARVGARPAGTLVLGGAIQDGAGNSLFISGQSGTGVVVLTGATKTYTGPLNIVRGIVQTGAANVLPAAGIVDVDNTSAAENATLDLNGFSQTIGGLQRTNSGGGAGLSFTTNSSATAASLSVNPTATATYSGTITGNLALIKGGAAQQTLSGAAANTFTGLTTVTAGRLHLGKTAGLNAVPGDLNITTGGQVTFAAGEQIADTAAVTMSDSGSVFNGTAVNTNVNNMTETIASFTATGGAFNAGTSTWTISGAASFTGGAGNTIYLGNSGSALAAGSLSLTGMTATPGATVATNNSFAVYGNSTTIQSTLTVGGGGLTLNGSVLNLRRGGAGALGSRLVLNGDVLTAGAAASSIVEDTAGGTTGTIEVELSGAAPAVNRTFTTAAGANLSIGVPLNDGASAAASVVKEGPATLTLQRVNTYTGNTTVNNGTLALAVASVNSIAASPLITLAAGAGLNVTGLTGSKIDLASGQTLRGEGTVTGGVNALSGATVSPAITGTGILNTGNASFNAGANFNVEINGLTAGTQYDQLNVTGTVSLGNGTLVLSGTLVPNPAVPQTIVLINNDGTDAVTGTFNGLAESAPISFNGGTLYISYVGGTGNDVTLVSQPPVNGTAAGDTLVVTPTATGYDYQLNGGPIVSLPLVLPLVFNGLGGDDLLIVNVNNNPIPQITYNGGAHDTPLTTGANTLHGDVLQVVDQTGTHTATYLAEGTVNAALDNDGTVTITGQNTIAFNGLEPVDLIGFLNANVTLPNANDVVTIATGTDSATNTLAALVVTGTSGGVAFEAVHLRNNTNVLIDTTTVNGNDTVTMNAGAGTTHGNVNFSVMTGAGTDTVAVTGGLQVTGAISVNTAAITDDANNATVLAAAAISLTTTGAIGTNVANADVDVTTANLTTSSVGNQFLRDTVALSDLNLNAGAANVTLTMAGSISDTAADGNDVVANVITFNMPTGGTIGAPANRVEIDGVTLTINYAGAAATNDVYLVDTAGGLRLNNASLSSSTNTTFDLLVTNGDLTSLVDGTRDIGADIIVLAVTGAGSTIGLSAAAPLEINAVVQLDASTSGAVGDSIWIEDTDNGLGVGLVNAGLGDVTLTTSDASAGDGRSLLEAGADAAADIVGGTVTLIVEVNASSTIGAGAGATLEINAFTLTATTAGGAILLEDTAGGVAINAITAVNGAVTLAATGGAITDDANDAIVDVTGSTITLTAASGVGESAGNGSLDTAATSLDVSVTAAGVINLSEADPVTLTDIDTANGSITVVAGGTITATDVASLTDNEANDISLTATTGNITLTTVNAGATAGDVNLTAAAGVITGGTVTADAIVAAAATGVTLNTVAVSLSATTSGVGNIVVTEANGANVLNVVVANGDATVTTPTGSLNVTTVSASGSVTLTATAGAITDANAAALNVTATLLNATAAGGINLDTAIAQLTAASTNSAIVIRETNGVAVNTVSAGTGNVTLTLAAGAITDNNGVGTLNVTAGLLDATGPDGGDLDTSVNSLAGTTTNSAFVIREANAVAVNLINAGTGMVSLAAGGTITDGNGGGVNNVTAGSLLLTSIGGIALDTTVGQLAASNAIGGDITITNTGALNITTLSEPTVGSVSGVLNPAGAVTVIALSPLSVNAPVSALGAVTLTASDSAGAGDDLTINATVTSTGSSITLNAGDNAAVNANLSASTTLAINIDAGDLDPNPVTGGATLNIAGPVVIAATSATFTGGGQGDSFTFAPQISTPITVAGLAPTANPNGDTLTIDTALATNPTLAILAGQGSGIYTFGNRASVQYSSIETATATTAIHISLDATATAIENIRLQRSAVPAGVNFEVYDTDTTNILYAGPIANVLSFLFVGSANSNTVTIDDVNGLVDLAGTVPAPTGVGNNGNVAGTPEIFLRGNGGTDGIVFANTANNTNQTYGLGTGTGPGSQAGEVLTTNGVDSLSVYFDGMEGVTSNDAMPGDTGTLTVVGDANANVMTLATSGGGTTMAVTGGYVPFTFAPQSFNAFTVNAGDGNDTIAINSLNPGEAGLAISLNGENNDDTISVGAAPAGSTLLMQGGVGNDAYQLGGALNTVDSIFIPVTISDPSGTDSLTVNDSSDLTGDTVTITATTIDGINSAPSPNVTFSGVESLDVTTSGGADTITTTLTGPNNLATVNVRGGGGDDDFFLTIADGLASPTTLNLIGEAGNDDFGSAMSPMRPVIGPATNVWVYGDTPAITTNPGGAITDRLFLDMGTSGGGTTVQPLIVVDTTAGVATATNTRTFRFGGIDDIDLYNGTELTDVQIGDVYMQGSSASERFVLYREQGGMMLKYNGSAAPFGPFSPAAPNGRMVIYGGAGADYMEFNFTLGATIGASFNGGADNDTLIGGLGNDTLAGGAGHDTLRGGEGADLLFGEDAPSTASAVPIATQRATGLVFSASGGNDTLDGGGGNDFVFGGIGDDNLNGGLGDDYVHGGDGNDTLNSGGGNDILRGEAGADLINGDTGADIILGGTGDDRIFGRGSRDFMLAGDGADQIQDSEGSEDVTVTGILSYDADAGFTLPGSSWTGLNDNDLALRALMFTGANAWNNAGTFAARTGNLSSFTSMTNDNVADIVLGNVSGQDYIISNTADMRLNVAGDLLVTL